LNSIALGEKERSVVAIAEKHVEVTYGSHRLAVPFAGLAVEQVRNALVDVLGVADSVEAWVNGKKASSVKRVQNGDRLVFVRTFGRKGADFPIKVERPPKPTCRFRIPAGAPPWVTEEEIAETIWVWQPFYEQPLTEDDALEILVNVRSLLDVFVQGHRNA
jgi:hypothetical protein